MPMQNTSTGRQTKNAIPKLKADQLQRVEDTPVLYRAALRKAYEGKAAPRGAIKAFCIQCVGGLRADVTNCSAIACPLHAYRPYQNGADDDHQEGSANASGSAPGGLERVLPAGTT